MSSAEPFTALDRHFAALVNRLAANPSSELSNVAGLLSQQRRAGNICVPAENLATSDVIGGPGEFKPLILENGRLYLRRYWEHEQRLAQNILARVHAARPKVNLKILRDGLKRHFPEPSDQRLAAIAAVTSNFCVISGGPGTGKTHTVAAVVQLLADQTPGQKPRIKLAAPTGKAAARLTEAMRKSPLAEEASTIHRLLGTIPDSPYFRHHAARPVDCDTLIIDEASMVDLALMSKLFDAVPPGARIILLGDKDQLASVEAGYVLGDICNTGGEVQTSAAFLCFSRELKSPPEPSMRDSIIELRKNYRFASGGGIYELSHAINRGDADTAIGLFSSGANIDITGHELPSPRGLERALRDEVVAGFRDYLAERDPAAALDKFSAFRILCALRRGPFGVETINVFAEQILTEAGLLEKTAHHYRGRPVLITRNDYNLRLFNGDIGILLPDLDGTGELRAFFIGADGKLRRFLPSRLPAHETAFAMTVHKSQGSEFARLLLILPDAEAPLLTRELLYTASTRAREHVSVWHREPVLRAAIRHRVQRASGLREALWK